MNTKFTKVCLCLGLAVTMCTTVLTGCGSSGDAVPVQTVASITGHGNTGYVNRFAGVVVAGNTNDIYLQSGMNVDEMNVEVGTEVKAGDVLFTYDTDYMELMITQAELEIESLKNTIETANTQIADLEKSLIYATDANRVTYTLEIQSLQMQIRENEYNINMKQADLDRQKENLRDTAVKSAVNGTVTAVNAKDATDNYGNPLPYIVITESGNMRIKATVNELNIGQVFPGEPVTILSRTDAASAWSGSISFVDYDNPDNSSNNNNYYYGPTDEYTSSSKYPFYVVLDNVDGLMMGQHVYIQMGAQELGNDTIKLPSFYINDADTSPWVWAANSKDKLEKRSIILGEYDPFMDEYDVLSGLSYEDAITPNTDGLKEGKAVTIYDGSDYLDQMPVDGSFDGGWDEGFEGEGFGEGSFPESEDTVFPEPEDGVGFEELLTDEFGDGTDMGENDAPAEDAPAANDVPAVAPAAGGVFATQSNIPGQATGTNIGG